MLHRRQRRPRRFPLALAALVLAPVALGPTAVAGNPPERPGDAGPARYLHVRPDGDDVAGLAQRLRENGFDLAGRVGSDLLVVGTPDDAGRLSRIGGHVVGSGTAPAARASPPTAYPKPARLSTVDYPTFAGGYRTTGAFDRFTGDVARAYPRLTRKVPYGESWSVRHGPQQGHQLSALCVTADADRGCDPQSPRSKPRLVVMGQIHARELTTSELAWRYTTDLVDGHGHDPEVTSLLRGTEVWIVPQVNPDGVDRVQEGLSRGDTSDTSPAWQRKNINDSDVPPDQPCAGGKTNQPGVDLNRNWDTHWGGPGTSDQPCAQTYRGRQAASEPETAQLASLFERLFPDRRGPDPSDPAPVDARGAVLNLHTFGDYVMFPWGHANTRSPNDAGLRSMAFRMSHFNGYRTGQAPEVLYASAGATDDWAYDRLGVPGFTFEVGPSTGDCSGFHPQYRCQQGFWERNVGALRYAAKAARAPYTTPLGPSVSALETRRKGGSVRFTGRASDDAHGTNGVSRPRAQPVTDVEVYFDRPPWEGGKPRPLHTRGNGSTVDIDGTVSAADEHRLVHVRARDADGNWGPVSATWLP